MISEAKLEMAKMTLIIKMLIALCPLMGLLGTVTGMIHVFDIMAVTGTGNARAMASGVSQATIPTMAGMVVAIAGLYFSRYIEDRTDDETHHLADLLKFH
jgi:biopolymer transport protein ExbB